jgi:hypothetical protein
MKTYLFIFLLLTTFFSFSQKSRSVYIKTGYSQYQSKDIYGVFLAAGSDYAIYKNLKLGFEGNAIHTMNIDHKISDFMAFSAGLSETFILKEKHNFILKATGGVGVFQKDNIIASELPFGFNAGYSYSIKKSALGVDFQMIFFRNKRFSNYGISYIVPF